MENSRRNKLIAFALFFLAVGLVTGYYLGYCREFKKPAPARPNLAVKENLIRVEKPVPDSFVSSPLIVKGEARGNWYFEATFPVKLLDADGKTLASHYAQAQGEWMTADFVPFEAVLNFKTPGTRTGTLVLKKSNPSGLTEHDDELRIPVVFARTRKINLYYYNLELDRDDEGNVLCGRKGLAPVEREIPLTISPVRDAINLLLKGELTPEEEARNIVTEYPLEGLALKNAVLRDGILTLTFDDPNNKTSGGACRTGILWFQIEATARQFPEVKEVKFLPEELFQP